MGKASKRKKQRRSINENLLSMWSKNDYICFIRDISLKADVIVDPPPSTIVAERLKILQFLEDTVITPEVKKHWEARQSEYLRGIVSILPQQLLVNQGIQVSPNQSLFEWNFFGEDELGLLVQSMFGSTKTVMGSFIANQLKEYVPEKEFLILASGVPIEFNSVEEILVKLGNLEESPYNIFFKYYKEG